jgi:hypothetical protein
VVEQKPVSGRIESVSDAFHVVYHPAIRIGFLDAQAGRPLDHDHILDRIDKETPRRALERVGWLQPSIGEDHARTVEIAQYRYEEGRKLHVEFGLTARAWGHPDFPPASVTRFIFKRFGATKND